MRFTQNVVMTTPNLRDIRHSRGLTLQQVAAAAGVNVGNLSRIERGAEFPRPPRVERLAVALNLPLTQVYAAIAAAHAAQRGE